MKRFILLLTAAFILGLTVLPAWAAEPATPVLTLNDAIKRALTYSETVKKAAKQVDLTEVNLDQKQTDLGYVAGSATGEPEGESAYASLLSASLTWQMSEKSLTTAQDSLTLSTCSNYWAIQLSLGNVEVAKQSLKQANLDLYKARIFNLVGLTAKDALLAAETKQASAAYSLQKAQNDLSTAYIAFNQVVGLWPEDRPVLTDELTFTPMDDVSLDVLVARVVDDSPTVWLADQKVEMQGILNDLMFYTGSYQPYEARKIELAQVKLDAVSAKEAAEILTRNMYYAVRSLEESYPAAEQAVKLAEENLRVAQVKYQVGMLTGADVSALETALAQSRQSLLELKKNHAYYILALEKPWAA
jgi:outer membrane protein